MSYDHDFFSLFMIYYNHFDPLEFVYMYQMSVANIFTVLLGCSIIFPGAIKFPSLSSVCAAAGLENISSHSICDRCVQEFRVWKKVRKKVSGRRCIILSLTFRSQLWACIARALRIWTLFGDHVILLGQQIYQWCYLFQRARVQHAWPDTVCIDDICMNPWPWFIY